MKKIANVIFFFAALFLSLSLVEPALAQSTFDFPIAQDGKTLFYNQDFGEIQQFDSQNKLSQTLGTETFGGFVHNVVWSPNGERMFVLAENIQPTVGSLIFYSSERPYSSLNWWMYDFKTKNATLFDKNIISVGWSSDNEAVYNWNNTEFSIVKISDSGFGSHAKLANISGGANDLNSIISPENLKGTLVFPAKNGFYAINTTEKKATYHLLAGSIKKVLPNIFSQDYFIIETNSFLYKFTVQTESLSTISSKFSATDIAFFKKDSLVLTDTDGKVFSYNVDDASKTVLTLNTSGNVSRVFSSGNEDEFLFVVGKNIYRFSVKNNASALLGLDWNTGGEHPLDSQTTQSPANSKSGASLTPVGQQQQATTIPSKNNVSILVIAGILVVIVGFALFFVYKKFLKK